ncbi:MAG TPA: sugar transferase [Gaiellaceae bacterium]
MSTFEPATEAPRLALSARHRAPGRGRHWLALAPIADALVLGLAVGVERVGWSAVGADGLSAAWLVGFPGIAIALLAAGGLYRDRLRLQLLDDLRTIAGATAIASMATIALPVMAGANGGSLSAQGVRLWLFSMVYLTASRGGIVSAVVAARRDATPVPTLIVGAGSVGRLLAKRLLEQREIGLAPVGFLDKEPLQATGDGPVLPVLGASWDLEHVIETYGVEHVIFTFSTAPHEVMLRMIDECTRRGVRVTLIPRLFERMPRDLTIDYLGGIPLISIHPSVPGAWRFRVKYALDRIVAAAILVVLSPVLLAIAAGVLVSLGRPVLFRQRRVGLDGREFDMLKFRSMTGTPAENGESDAAWADAQLGGARLSAETSRDRGRDTRLGSLLRSSSLDELPQLINVARGEMSLVGPRPERVSYVDRFEDSVYRYTERHRVKAGITGWAQINGLRGNTSLADRVEWDNWYIENWSPWLDVKIALKTFRALVHTG